MAHFKYVALSRDGVKISGVMEGYNQLDAASRIKESCDIILNLKEIEEKKSSFLSMDVGGNRLNSKAFTVMCSQFAIILEAGIPIARAVKLVADKTTDKPLRRIMDRVARDVEGGRSLSAAFADYGGKILPITFIETLCAGEATGNLGRSFETMHEHFDKQVKMRAKVRSAMAYPMFVLAIAVAAMMGAGLTMDRAVSITAKVVDNYYLSHQTGKLAELLESGHALGASMREQTDYPDILIDMAGVGENSGEMEKTLGTIAAYYDAELEDATKSALLLIAVIALMVIIAIPIAQRYPARSEDAACALAIASAQRKIDESEVLAGGELSAEEARLAATQAVKDWDELCPSGGDCYLLPKQGGYTVVCALHTDDAKLRTRLNADRALTKLREALDAERLLGRAAPETVSVTVNGEELPVLLTWAETGLTRGTLSTPGYEGTVAFYMTDGADVVYFSYADEAHCANWSDGAGWTGDSFT